MISMNTLKHGISTVLLLLGAACSSDNTTDAPRAVLTVGISIDGEEFRQGEPIQFYGNAEVENGEIASYFWHFGFRGDETNHAEVQNPLVTFPAGGNFTVKFTVTSRDGAVATATREIYVIPDNMRPTAAFCLGTRRDHCRQSRSLLRRFVRHRRRGDCLALGFR